MNHNPIMEPYKIKSVEPIRQTERGYRKKALLKAHLNLFFLPARDVMIDLLTDSGTGAMSAAQWSLLMRGDESYAGSESFFELESEIKDITGMPFVIPVHQGRSAERLLFHLLEPKGSYIVSNTLFDTTRANAEDLGFKIKDLPCPEFFEESGAFAFKGNVDLKALEDFLNEKPVGAVILTITNNSGGGCPVSYKNIQSASRICKKKSVPLILDACRFAENAYFIKKGEPGFQDQSPRPIARKVFDLADMSFMSAKKDGLCHIGGFITVRSKSQSLGLKNLLILREGFPTYGGLAGRDLSAMAQGLREALQEPYLAHRTAQTAYLHKRLKEGGIPLIEPPGGHAVYIDAKKLLPHIPVARYPGQALVSALYEYAGIRTCEIGSVMFGKSLPDGQKSFHSKELVRLCLPRRLYTASHLDYIANSVVSFVKDEARQLKGVKFTYEPPVLRHFTAHFAYL